MSELQLACISLLLVMIYWRLGDIYTLLDRADNDSENMADNLFKIAKKLGCEDSTTPPVEECEETDEPTK